MKTTVDCRSPWGNRLWFEDHEFDAMMDEVRQKSGQANITPGEGVDVEAILEKVYRVVPDFVVLPEGILGKTVFHRDGRLEVLMSRALSEEAEREVVARRRLRATAAHECTHVVAHGHLHLVDTHTISMFGDTKPPAPKVLCRRDSINRPGYSGEWWEYQANRGMASLLLPKAPVASVLNQVLAARGCTAIEEATRRGVLQKVVRDLMEHFDVSMQLVTYRLQQLGKLPKTSGQTSFAMEERETA